DPAPAKKDYGTPGGADFDKAAYEAAAAPDDKPMTKRTQGQLFALFGQKGIGEDQQLSGINYRVGGAYTSRADVTEADARTVIGYLKSLPDAETSDEATA
ncbi:MAG TPA: hypothetical protein VKZ43_02945, partial [Trueperaceae bacterium]|nr:hypothetical protein [Trueperaceae bacterium]